MTAQRWRVAPGLDLSDQTLDAVARLCLKNSEYEFTSGGHGDAFYDFDEFLGTDTLEDLTETKTLLERFVRRIKQLRDEEGYRVLAFVEGPRGPAGAISARLALAEATGMPTMIVRPYKRVLSQAVKPFRTPTAGKILIISDVATSGRSLSDAAQVLWRLGARECGALSLYDADRGAEELLDSFQIPFYFVYRPPVEITG